MKTPNEKAAHDQEHAGQGYLEHALPLLQDFLGTTKRVLFAPYAGVRVSYDDYAANVRERFEAIGYGLDSLHDADDVAAAVDRAEAIAVGGGNTFHLLRALAEHDLIGRIRERVLGGLPYVGWSAGSNVTKRQPSPKPKCWPAPVRPMSCSPTTLSVPTLRAQPASDKSSPRFSLR